MERSRKELTDKEHQNKAKAEAPICNIIKVHFWSLDKPNEDKFCLEMSRLCTYDDVVERVAKQLGLDDPSKIRLTPHSCYSQYSRYQPIKYRGVDHLSNMLFHHKQTWDILYYEVLDIPLPELQCLETLKVACHHATKDEVVIHTIRLPKHSTVGDVLDDLKTKVEMSHPDAELRLLKIFNHKIYKVFPLNEKIEDINERHCTLRVEEIPEEEKNIGPHDCFIRVIHFTKDTAQNQMKIQNFGEPFLLVVHEAETLIEIKARIQKKLHVPDDEFAKWKFVFLYDDLLSSGHPEYLQDSDIVSCLCFQKREVYRGWEHYLGLEHIDNAPKSSYAVNQVPLVEANVDSRKLDAQERTEGIAKGDAMNEEHPQPTMQMIMDRLKELQEENRVGFANINARLTALESRFPPAPSEDHEGWVLDIGR